MGYLTDYLPLSYSKGVTQTYSGKADGGSIATLSKVDIDCAEPAQLAEFYADALAWTVAYSDNDYGVVEGDGVRIGFGKIEGFQPAVWPDEEATKRFHLDLLVDDLASATERLCAIGARRPANQPGVDRWRILLDPSGQPFCLSQLPDTTSW